VQTGTGITFQWQQNDVPLQNGGVFSISTDNTHGLSTLSISDVTGLDNTNYNCIVSGTCSPVVVSNTVNLYVKSSPTITGFTPSSDTRCAGSSSSFTVSATGDNLSYQWQENGIDISALTDFSDFFRI